MQGKTWTALMLAAAAIIAADAQAQVIKRAPAPSAAPVTQMIVKLRNPDAAERVSGMAASRAARLSEVGGKAMASYRAMSGDASVLRLLQPLSVTEAQALAQKLAQDPTVEWAAADLPVRRFQATPPDANFTPRQWNYLPANAQFVSANLATPASTVNFSATGGANAPVAWTITRGSPSVRVAVVDSGVVLNHPDLVANLLPGFDFVSSDALAGAPYNAPLNFVANDGNGRDLDANDPGDWISQGDTTTYPTLCGTTAEASSWHGTSMTGLIASLWTSANPNPPGTSLAGLAPEVKIVPVRALGKCGGVTSDVIDGIRWAAGLTVPGAPPNANPARIINLSLGTTAGACSAAYQTAINDVLATGAIVVAASGNDGASAVSQPANCTGVIGVTAHTINGDNATYANIGPEVAISAPGGGAPSRLALQPLDENATAYYIWAASMFGATTQDSPFSATDTRTGAATTGLTGTSPAAAQVSGAVALLLSVDPSLSAQQVRAYLTSTARPHPAGSYCLAEPTALNKCGSGLLDVGAAVNAAYQARLQADAARSSGGGGGGALPLAPLLLLVALGLARRVRLRPARD